MMNGTYGIGVVMMIFGSAAALAVLTLVILAAAWLARDLGTAERRSRRARCVPQPSSPSTERR